MGMRNEHFIVSRQRKDEASDVLYYNNRQHKLPRGAGWSLVQTSKFSLTITLDESFLTSFRWQILLDKYSLTNLSWQVFLEMSSLTSSPRQVLWRFFLHKYSLTCLSYLTTFPCRLLLSDLPVCTHQPVFFAAPKDEQCFRCTCWKRSTPDFQNLTWPRTKLPSSAEQTSKLFLTRRTCLSVRGLNDDDGKTLPQIMHGLQGDRMLHTGLMLEIFRIFITSSKAMTSPEIIYQCPLDKVK